MSKNLNSDNKMDKGYKRYEHNGCEILMITNKDNIFNGGYLHCYGASFTERGIRRLIEEDTTPWKDRKLKQEV